MKQPHKTVPIVGAGERLSASLARRHFATGFRVALAARDINKLADRQRLREQF